MTAIPSKLPIASIPVDLSQNELAASLPSIIGKMIDFQKGNIAMFWDIQQDSAEGAKEILDSQMVLVNSVIGQFGDVARGVMKEPDLRSKTGTWFSTTRDGARLYIAKSNSVVEARSSSSIKIMEKLEKRMFAAWSELAGIADEMVALVPKTFSGLPEGRK